ncbi:TA system VapC family ribonuclease toxin [Propioniciclava soli]|uniref:Ribonuclease VapC n=1 Tax=Propioniciclava soli TaxID=2775081 RepID=A0ABZ3C625_9ACTN|nr:TA system VapC family ribonuclease toxin [Propioniciclava soli]
MTRATPSYLLDANVLVALCLSNHVHHRDAHAFLTGVEGWATTPLTEVALYRLLLNPAVAGRPTAVREVDDAVRGFRKDPRWSFVPDASSLAFAGVDASVLVGHRQAPDLHLLNLARSNDLILATFDRAMSGWLVPADRHLVHPIPVTV